MKKLPISFLIVAFLLTGCLFQDNVDEVLLRINNVSDINFSSVMVGFPGESMKFDTIVSGGTSAYKNPDVAYRYGSITVNAGDVDYRLVPYDYVGEEPLSEGKYTFEINIIEGNLTLDFKQN